MNNLPYTIEDLRNICSDDTVILTLHTQNRLTERGISYSEVFNTIMYGSVIEEYPDDKPFPSCLLYGRIECNNLHVVLSSDGEYIYIITAYRPSEDKWNSDFKTRKRG